MGRPGLTKHRKFIRLERLLKSHLVARGALETIWDACYESGDDYLGDSLDVEGIARWTGDEGVLTNALAEAGFIDETPDSPGHFQVHDFWHHAPEYVPNRRNREEERRKEKTCEYCGNLYHSSDARSKYCSSRCKTYTHRIKTAEGVTDCDGSVRNSDGCDGHSDGCDGHSDGCDGHSDGQVTDCIRTVTESDGTPITHHPSPHSPLPTPNSLTSSCSNTPLTPQGESAGDTPEKTKASRRSKRRSRQEILTDLELEGISQEAIAAGQEIRGFWTKIDKDGRKIETSLDMLIPRLDDIHKRQPLFTFPVLILAGKLYIDTPKKATKAAQHFFSLEPEKATGKPPFYDWARAAKHKIDAGVVSEPRAPDPAPPEPTPLIPLAEGFTMPDGVAE